jgi:carbonic anhydrase
MVIHHTRCGLETFDEATLASAITKEVGIALPFTLGAYSDVEDDVRATVATLASSPFITNTDIRGFVFSVDDGDLREVTQ